MPVFLHITNTEELGKKVHYSMDQGGKGLFCDEILPGSVQSGAKYETEHFLFISCRCIHFHCSNGNLMCANPD